MVGKDCWGRLECIPRYQRVVAVDMAIALEASVAGLSVARLSVAGMMVPAPGEALLVTAPVAGSRRCGTRSGSGWGPPGCKSAVD